MVQWAQMLVDKAEQPELLPQSPHAGRNEMNSHMLSSDLHPHAVECRTIQRAGKSEENVFSWCAVAVTGTRHRHQTQAACCFLVAVGKMEGFHQRP